MTVAARLSDRARALDISGIRRAFELGASLQDPVNLSIGQPDFPVPDAIKRAAAEAIDADRNGYTLTQGVAELRTRISAHLEADLGWRVSPDQPFSLGDDEASLFVTAGTSGALLLTALALLNAGDEMIIPDPYFVLYPALALLCGGAAVRCDTYPDFRMTAQRVEPMITARTKFVLCVSPANPTGVAMTPRECRDLLDLCRARGVTLVSDEIYDEFAFRETLDPSPARGGANRCPSPARFEGAERDVLVIRGFGKTYGCTGWRMGYVAGPGWLVKEMMKLQQYTFVCAPSMAQWGCLAAFDVDMSPTVEVFRKRRDMVLGALGGLTEIPTPGGAFYAFVKVPERLGLTGTAFMERLLEKNVIVIPGGVFSDRDTHFRLSFAVKEDRLAQGLEAIASLMR